MYHTKLSELFTRTSKTAPADETAHNARLLIQAGFVYKVMSGVYAYTPLGLRVLENIKQVVREEMNKLGAQELIMTSLQRRDTWEATGRWDDEVVDIWFKTHLKDGTELGLAWSHEETIIEMMKQHISSYKDLPANVYQFQTKLRNELRAKSGVMRGREFVMKDMYSCSLDAKQHDAFYNATIDAYKNVFNRLGIGQDTYVTFASGGAFTQFSHEFQTVCEAGEDIIYRVPSTGECFNEEIAPSMAPTPDIESKELLPMEDVKGDDIVGVDKLAKFLKIPVGQTTKTMLYVSDKGEFIAAAVRGGYQINEDKLKAVLGVKSIELADESAVERVTGAKIGYAGLLNLPAEVKVVVDESCAKRTNFEMGSNRTNHHTVNVNWGRDLPEPEQYYDIKTAKKGDLNPDTKEVYEVLKSAEVGNIFNFGTQKSEEMDFAYTDETGSRQYVHLGSYGIGITRLIGVLAEKFADDKGLVWPEVVAPARVQLLALGNDPEVSEAADQLYESFKEKGVSVIYDDRDTGAGAKFADADLMGTPFRVVVSRKTLADSAVEFKPRTSDEAEMVPLEQIVSKIKP